MSEWEDLGFRSYSDAELADMDKRNNEYLLEKYNASENEILDTLGFYAQLYQQEFMSDSISENKAKPSAEQKAQSAEINAEIKRVQGELNTALIKHAAIEDFLRNVESIIHSYGEDNYRFHKHSIDDDLVVPAEQRLRELQRDDSRDRRPQEWGLTPKIRRTIPGMYDYRLFVPELFYHTVYTRNLVYLFNGTKAKAYGMEASSVKKIGKLFSELQELKGKKNVTASIAAAAVATPITLFDLFGEEFRATNMKNFQTRLKEEDFSQRLFFFLKSAPDSHNKQVIKGKLNSPYIDKTTCSSCISPDAVLSLVRSAAEGALPLTKNILAPKPKPKNTKRQTRSKTKSPADMQPSLFDWNAK